MGIDVPTLDDRRYEELLEDLRKRIPIESAEWTDHNAHDPGITILETLTWLAESYRFQLDQIEAHHREKYLELLGIGPESPRAATARVRVEPGEALVGETVPAGTQLVADGGSGTQIFETKRPATLTSARVTRVITDTDAGRTDLSDAHRSTGTFVRPFGRRARVGSTAYLGFDGDPFADPVEPLELAVDFHTEDLPVPAEHGNETPDFEPSVELAWEYCTDYGSWEHHSAWSELDVLEDTTNSLYGSGIVTLANPGPTNWEGVQRTGTGVQSADAGFAWLRVRLVRSGYEVPPQIDRFESNVLAVEHRASAGPEQLDRSDGGETTSAQPHQHFEFERSPVLEATITVGGTEWEEKDNFDASGPDDTHYVLSETEGQIRFGDNVRGAVPEAGQSVVATSYEFGGGPAGNLAADADWRFARPDGPAPAASDGPGPTETGGDSDGLVPLPVRNADIEPVGSASGGRAAEDLDEALARLQRDLNVPYRAVTAADCEYVAEHTPGLRFGRTKAVVSEGVRNDDCTDHDVVEVVVVPYSPSHVDRPEPSEGFLEAVDCHLEGHRLVTDRVDAVAPTYVGIGVSVEVELLEGYSADRRADAIGTALDMFLSPLSGFDGDGWPFGRSVYRSELYETVDAVEGIDCVVDIDVTVEGDPRMIDGEVDIEDEALVYPTDHEVEISGERRECGEVR